MRRRPWPLGIFWLLAGVTAVAPPTWALQNGTNRPKDHPARAERGRLLLFSLQGTKATKVAEAWTGKNTQGVTFTPDGKYILVQNYVEKELAAYRLTGTGLEDTALCLKVSGHPASIRIAP